MNSTHQNAIEARARRLREARKRLFPSAQAAAAALGINATTVRSHENAQNGYPVSAAQRYADAYGVTLDWLLAGGDMDLTSKPAEHGPKAPVTMTSLPGGRARLEMSVTLPFATAVQVLALVQEGQKS